MERKVSFKNGFHGELHLDDTVVKIGKEATEARPYDLLMGALAGCLYATFIDVLVKKRIDVTSCDITVSGEKRTEIPTTLERVHLKVEIASNGRNEAVLKSFELACKYCSIYETVSKVATITYDVVITSE